MTAARVCAIERDSAISPPQEGCTPGSNCFCMRRKREKIRPAKLSKLTEMAHWTISDVTYILNAKSFVYPINIRNMLQGVQNFISEIMNSMKTLLTPTSYITSGEYHKQTCTYCYRMELKQLQYENHDERLNRKYAEAVSCSRHINARLQRSSSFLYLFIMIAERTLRNRRRLAHFSI